MLAGTRRTYSRLDHQILGEALRRLDPRRFARRSKYWKPARLKQVHYSGFERGLGSHERQIDELIFRQMGQLFVLVDCNRDAAGECRDSRVTGRRDQLETGIVAA